MKLYELTKTYRIVAKNRKEAEEELRECQDILDVCISFDENLVLVNKDYQEKL